MNCETAREAMSALMDVEASPVAGPQLKAHLERCATCRAWRDRAHEVTRRMRLASATPVPPPSARLYDALADARPAGWWRSERALVRAGLVFVAVVQLVVTLPVLILGSDHGAPIHVAHEMGSFDIALAAGFLIAALRPSRAQGMGPLVGVAALLLITTAVIDLAAGRTSPSDEAPHLLAVAGWMLLRRLAMLTPSSSDDGSLSLGSILRSRRRSRTAWGADALLLEDRHDQRGTAAVAHADATVDGFEEQVRRAASG